MDSAHSIVRSARHFFAGTSLSRISGFARDVATAACFGSAPEIAAFMVAYRLANLFRRLLGEGNLQAGFVPQFEAYRAESRERASQFYRNVSASLAVVLLGAVVLLEALLWGCRAWVGSDDWRGIAELAMWMAPGLFFICMYGLNSSLLQCEKKYFLPAAAPVAFNFLWILAAGIVWHLPKEEAVRWLAIAVTGAFGAQWLATAPAVRRLLVSSGKREFFSLDWKKLLKPLTLGTLGVGAVQLNSALDAVFARLADPEGPAFLWYAIRIEQLPLALFGLALSGAVLPPLARALQAGNFGLYRELLQSALKQSAALMLFCTFGILAIGGAGINFLYGHGDFTSADVRETLGCLWAYGAGLVPSVFVLLLAAGFYAQKSYRIPTLAALSSVAFHAALNAFFIFALHLGAVSIALSTSLAAILNAALLARGLQNAVGSIFPASLTRFLTRTTACFALPGFLVWGLGTIWLGGEFTRSFAQQTAQFLTLSALYIGSSIFFARKFKLRELWNLLRGNRKNAES